MNRYLKGILIVSTALVALPGCKMVSFGDHQSDTSYDYNQYYDDRGYGDTGNYMGDDQRPQQGQGSGSSSNQNVPANYHQTNRHSSSSQQNSHAPVQSAPKKSEGIETLPPSLRDDSKQ